MPLPPDSSPPAPLGPDGMVPIGTVVYAPPSRIAEALKGYVFMIQFASPRGVSLQQCKFTGETTDKGVEMIVLAAEERPE